MAASTSTSESAGPPPLRPPRPDFSTRSEGIPVYNALLDSHLGKRREFLLGNKHSLQLLQRTGAIARVEAHRDNASQYVVYMNEKKAAGATSANAAPEPGPGPRYMRRPKVSHELYGRVSRDDADRQHRILKSVKRSASTPQLTLYQHLQRRNGNDDDDDERDEDVDPQHVAQNHCDRRGHRPNSKPRMDAAKGAAVAALFDSAETKLMSRRASTPGLFGSSSPFRSADGGDDSATPAAHPASLIDHLRRRRVSHGSITEIKQPQFGASVHQRPQSSSGAKTAIGAVAASSSPMKQDRSAVERLLESDATYQLKIQILRDEMRVLENEKQYFDTQISVMRKQLRGINAVHENDVAVAHCAAIMHARISKAEEEYMKLVTAQQQVKVDIDTLRRELLAMRKVAKKLQDDIHDVEMGNAQMDDKIKSFKKVRNVLSHELIELERQAEIEADEQRLKLPPEEDVVVDAQELMSAVQLRHSTKASASTRRSTVVLTAGSPLAILQRMLSDSKAIVAETLSTEKPLLSFRSAFRVIQQTLGVAVSLETFVSQFEETENELLSKHKLHTQLQEEVDQLEKEAATLAKEARVRHASIRGTQQLTKELHNELQDKIQKALERIDSYNELRDVRNLEHTKLRAIMQKCLEILHAEKLVSSQETLHGPLLLSELTSPAMLEALQKKMTEVAITLKLKHNSNTGSGERPTSATGKTRTTRETRDTRRSNLLLKRDTGNSKIVLGPREPSGAALTAILITAQPPTVEGAQALSETHAAGMHALHPSIISATVDAATTATPTRKLTVRRMASIRASKHAAPTGRRISVPEPTATTAPQPHKSLRHVSMVWPMKKTNAQGSTDSIIQAEDAYARVIEDTDELDAE